VSSRRPSWRVLAVTNMYPTPATPAYGAFVASQMASIAETGAGVEIDFIDGRRGMWQYALAVPRIRRLVRSGRFDLVHAHYGLAGWAAGAQPLPLVVSFCGDDLLGTPGRDDHLTWKSRIGVRLSQAAAHRADAIICKSESLRARLGAAADRERAHVIPNGVDTRVFTPGSRAAARERLGLEQAERLILFPSSPEIRRKRHDLAEAAVRVFQEEGATARLWVLHGVVPEQMPDVYRAADCLIVTSDWEGSPNVVKEALCCDIPVVSVDVGDTRLWLERAQGSALVARDPAAIAAGLRAVLGGTTRVDGSAVRQAIDARGVAARVLDVYAEAVARHRASRRAGDRGPHSRA